MARRTNRTEPPGSGTTKHPNSGLNKQDEQNEKSTDKHSSTGNRSKRIWRRNGIGSGHNAYNPANGDSCTCTCTGNTCNRYTDQGYKRGHRHCNRRNHSRNDSRG